MKKQDNFRRLAEKRTNKVLEKIRVLGNLSNKRLYQYSDDEIKKIFTVLEKVLQEVRTLFDKPKPKLFSWGKQNPGHKPE